MADTGAIVEESLPPRIEEAWPITLNYWKRPDPASPDEWLTNGEAKLSSEEVEQHMFTWDRFRRGMIGFMTTNDVILTPVAEQSATPHGTNEGGVPYTLTYSLTGWPCAAVRAGTSPEGLPIGIQIVACHWRDIVALAVAQVIEHSFGG